MSLEANELVRAMKQAALDAVHAEVPAGVCFGVVTSVSPLEIQVDQKLPLTAEQLLLTDNVRDYNVELTTYVGGSPGAHLTEEESGGSGYAAFERHRHKYEGRKKWRVHNALQLGEKVILLRCDGGQKYIVLDRWEART